MPIATQGGDFLLPRLDRHLPVTFPIHGSAGFRLAKRPLSQGVGAENQQVAGHADVHDALKLQQMVPLLVDAADHARGEVELRRALQGK